MGQVSCRSRRSGCKSTLTICVSGNFGLDRDCESWRVRHKVPIPCHNTRRWVKYNTIGKNGRVSIISDRTDTARHSHCIDNITACASNRILSKFRNGYWALVKCVIIVLSGDRSTCSQCDCLLRDTTCGYRRSDREANGAGLSRSRIDGSCDGHSESCGRRSNLSEIPGNVHCCGVKLDK